MMHDQPREDTTLERNYLLTALVIVVAYWYIMGCTICLILSTICRPTSKESRRRRALTTSPSILICFLAVIKIVFGITILIFTFMSGSLKCKTFETLAFVSNQSLALFHIAESDPLMTLAAMALQSLPFIHIPFMLLTISNEFANVNAATARCIKIWLYVNELIITIAYGCTAIATDQQLSDFNKSISALCVLDSKYWRVGLACTYCMSAICPLSVFVSFARDCRISRNRKRVANQKREATFSESCETAESTSSFPLKTAIEPDDDEYTAEVYITPENSNGKYEFATLYEMHPYQNAVLVIAHEFQPLVLNRKCGGTLHLRNLRSTQWVALRILMSCVDINVYPHEFLIPPGRTASVRIWKLIQLFSKADVSVSPEATFEKKCNLLCQWFLAGSECPPCNSKMIWRRPYRAPRNRWSHRFIDVYFESDCTRSSGSKDEEVTNSNTNDDK
ncbi:unnamed protein product [Anisakis simplex]|uniref:G_PROTEIN_RECEP_F1_2 domain-containing protein n=1 Tax=Anisakis simplex TaxID=6269 RepID=A0A0M3K6H0_ANISI|nr:unnamed protein product [Anisakis simplex]